MTAWLSTHFLPSFYCWFFKWFLLFIFFFFLLFSLLLVLFLLLVWCLMKTLIFRSLSNLWVLFLSVYWNQLKHKQQVVVHGRTFNARDKILMKMISFTNWTFLGNLITNIQLHYFSKIKFQNEIQNHIHYYAFPYYGITQVYDKLFSKSEKYFTSILCKWSLPTYIYLLHWNSFPWCLKFEVIFKWICRIYSLQQKKIHNFCTCGKIKKNKNGKKRNDKLLLWEIVFFFLLFTYNMN